MKVPNAQTRGARNAGIDALRLVSMLMIVVLHIVYPGGARAATAPFSLRFYTAASLEVAAFPAVNIYALISGYVGVNGRPRLSRLALLWLQVAVYSFAISALFFVLRPGTLSVWELLISLLPAVSGQYWYFSAYFALFLFMPFLNAGLEKLSDRHLDALVLAGFAAFSVLTTLLSEEGFRIHDGYSALWLMYLYVAGGWLKRRRPLARLTPAKVGLAGAAALLLALLSVPSIAVLSRVITGKISYLRQLIRFCSPLMAFAALCAVEFFARLNVPARLGSLIERLVPLSFSVYLIHTHPLVFRHFIRGRFAPLGSLPAPLMVLAILGCAAAIFAACCAVDALRLRLFEALGLRRRLEKLIDARLER